MDMVEVDGLHIAYERVGSGPALALLHGYVGDGPTMWRPQLDGLAGDARVDDNVELMTLSAECRR
jgi:hypothetical protein